MSVTREARLNKQIDEIDELRQKQLSGDFKLLKGNTEAGKDYEFSEFESKFIHVRVVKKQANIRTNQIEVVKDVVLKETIRDYESKTDLHRKDNETKRNAYGEYDIVEVLFDPRLVKEEESKDEEKPERLIELESKSAKDLKELAVELGVEVTGNKGVIAKAIFDHEQKE